MKLFRILLVLLPVIIIKVPSSRSAALNNVIKCDEFIESNQFVENNATSTNKCTFKLISFESIDDEITLLPPLRQPKDSNFLVDHSNLIETVEFIDCNFPQIPSNVLERFVNLRTLSCDDVSLKSLTTTHFGLTRKLESLSMMRNQLTSLGSAKFAELENLEFLDFSINKIDDIKRSSFSGLIRLKKLFLNENDISMLPTQDVFDELIALEEIGLSQNRLQTVGANLFMRCERISYVYLDRNQLVSVHDDFLVNKTELHFVELSSNQLKRINFSFSSSALYANNNQLKSARLNSIGYLSFFNNSLHELVLDDNAGALSLNISTNKFTYESLANILNLVNMKSLDLSFNNLGRLETSSLLNLTSLQILNLQFTNITEIPYGLFTHQTSLEQLDISYCDLKRFELGKLTSLKNLTTLFIEGNSISTIFDYANLRAHLPSLKMFGFSDNLWPCSFLASLIAYLNQHEIESFTLVLNKLSSNVDGIGCVNYDGVVTTTTTSTDDGNLSSTLNPIKHHRLYQEELQNISSHIQHLQRANEHFVTRHELIAELSELKSLLIAMQQQINDINGSSMTLTHHQSADKLMSELDVKINSIESKLRMKSSEEEAEKKKRISI